MKLITIFMILFFYGHGFAGRHQKTIDAVRNPAPDGPEYELYKDYYKKTLLTEEKTEFRDHYKSLYKNIYKEIFFADDPPAPDDIVPEEPEPKPTGFSPAHMYPRYYELVQSLYLAGYISNDAFKTWDTRYKQDLKNDLNENSIDFKNDQATYILKSDGTTRKTSADLSPQELSSLRNDENRNGFKLVTISANPKIYVDANNFLRNTTEYLYYEKKLVNAGPNATGANRTAIDLLMEKIQTETRTCAKEGQYVGNNKCCVDHIAVTALKEGALNNNLSCKKQNVTCSENSNCCSNKCYKEDPATNQGVCLPENVCTRIRMENEKCDLQNQMCDKSSCLDYGQLQATINYECKIEDVQCTTNDQCCSNSCKNNKCEKIMQCMNCKSDNSLIKGGEKCCPGYIEFNNRCLPPIPQFIPTVKVEKKFQHFFSKILNLFISSTYASETTNKNLTEGQAELIAEKTKVCENKFSAGSSDRDTCMLNVEQQKTYYAEDGYSGLNEKQLDIIAEMKQTCAEKHKTDTSKDSAFSKCMENVTQKEKGFLTDNSDKASACEKFITGSLEFKECMFEQGALGVNLQKEDYIDKYNIPGVTAKTYSDANNCEFNSYNDSWRDASQKERNAELFLRSFEYVFSHKGTKDYWVDQNQKSIFERAHEVAVKFRENRKKLINAMIETDKVMTCKCIGYKGPDQFKKDTAKIKYFMESCPDEAAAYNLNNNSPTSGENNNGANLSGTNKNIDDAKFSEIDKGATAISGEQFLVDWLNLKAQNQMQRFSDNSELEEKLSELSKSITDTDFSEVFKDKIVNKQPKAGPNGAGDSTELYKWGYTYRPGWMKIAMILVGAVAFFFIPGVGGIIMTSLVVGLGGVVGGAIGSLILSNSTATINGINNKAAVTSQMVAAWRYSEYDEINARPEIVDIKTAEGCAKRKWGVCLKKYKGFTRYLLGPRYEHPFSKQIVYGRASALFRSGYRVDYNNAINFMLDPTLPLFVPENKVSIKGMHGTPGTPSFVELLNSAYERGRDEIAIYKKPSGHLKGSYLKESKKFGQKPLLAEIISKGHFIPGEGKYNDFYFEESSHGGKNIIMAGAQKYALCKSLKECGATELVEDQYGLGYLFESKSEAKVWSEYTYEIHYKWSHLSRNNFMGYPLVGLDTYFQTLAFKMKLAGSLAASRSIQAFEAAELYTKDLEKRNSDYNSVQGELATGRGRNTKFTRSLFKQFGRLNFSGKTDLANLNDLKSITISANSGLGQGELQVLTAGVNAAIRRNADIDKKDAFDKAVLNSSDQSKNLIAKNTAFLNKATNPLNQFGMAKLGGGGAGFKRLSSAISGLNQSLEDFNKEANNNRKTPTANYTPSFTMPNRADFGSSSNSNYSTPLTSDPANTQNDHNLSDQNISGLLNELKQVDLEPNQSDSLFTVVSKAYKRNYSRVLKRSEKSAHKGHSRALTDPESAKHIDSQSKNKLRKLLQD